MTFAGRTRRPGSNFECRRICEHDRRALQAVGAPDCVVVKRRVLALDDAAHLVGHVALRRIDVDHRTGSAIVPGHHHDALIPEIEKDRQDRTAALCAPAQRHSAAWTRPASMMLLISERQEPQLVPALSRRPISSTVVQPEATAEASWLTPTLKQEQTMRPTDGIGTGERPDSSAMRSAGDSGCRDAEQRHQPVARRQLLRRGHQQRFGHRASSRQPQRRGSSGRAGRGIRAAGPAGTRPGTSSPAGCPGPAFRCRQVRRPSRPQRVLGSSGRSRSAASRGA